MSLSVKVRALGSALAALLAVASLHAESSTGVRLGVGMANPVVLAGGRQRGYLRVSLTGYAPESPGRRPPVNVALVLDRSGSMTGEKLENAKEAALVALDMLDQRDVLSVVTYDDTVSVLVGATELRDRDWIAGMIRRIRPGGSTALFAGVARGAGEVRTALSPDRVNRVILLSDGLANVGPSTPGVLGDLGASLRKEGISVSTIGLGLDYNEDLMVRLARSSDGNHAFVESPNDLVRIFSAEFRDILNVVARDVTVRIRCADGVVPLRAMGRDADIAGQDVYIGMSQIYGNQEKYVILEVELPDLQAGKSASVADVELRYTDLVTREGATSTAHAAVAFSESPAAVRDRADRSTLVEVVRQQAAETSEKAVELRDQGKVKEAKDLLEQTAELLSSQAQDLDAPVLEEAGEAARRAASNLDDESWNAERKQMRSEQYATQNQQSY